MKDNVREGWHYYRKDYWDKRNQSILKKLKEKYND